jgi:hypothetical protein
MVDEVTISPNNITVSPTEEIYTSKVTVQLPSVRNTSSQIKIIVSAPGEPENDLCQMNQLFSIEVDAPSAPLSQTSTTTVVTEETPTTVGNMMKSFANVMAQKMNFKDVSLQSWERPFVDKVSSAGIMTGYADGSGRFGKDDSVTNAQLVKVGIESFNFDIPDTVTSAPFEDVAPNEWFAPYLLKSKELGITPRILNGRVSPNQNISRGETLKLLVAFAGIDLSEIAEQSPFPDVSDGRSFTKSIVWATQNGIVDGYQNGDFGPYDSLTRGQLAKIVVNLIEFLERE